MKVRTLTKACSRFLYNFVSYLKHIFAIICLSVFQSGVYGKYIVQTRGSEERIYNVTLKVNTPFKAFPKLNLFGAFETEENFYRTKLLFNTNRSDISLDATTEVSRYEMFLQQIILFTLIIKKIFWVGQFSHLLK